LTRIDFLIFEGSNVQLTISRIKGGLLKQKQWKILELRAKGFTQLETAKKLGTSRANVSMIEYRAKKKLERARETIQIYETLCASHRISFGNEKVSRGKILHDYDGHAIRSKAD